MLLPGKKPQNVFLEDILFSLSDFANNDNFIYCIHLHTKCLKIYFNIDRWGLISPKFYEYKGDEGRWLMEMNLEMNFVTYGYIRM